MVSKSKGKPFDPVQYALSGSEDAHQIALFGWAALADVRAKYPELKYMFHIPNGGSRHKAEAGKLRAMGVKAGVLDVFLAVARGPWHGLWIELKRPSANGKRKGIASEDQRMWLNQFRFIGHGAVICTGWEEARDAIIQYLEWKE